MVQSSGESLEGRVLHKIRQRDDQIFRALYILEIDTIVYDNKYLDEIPPKLANELESKFLEAHSTPFSDLFTRYDKEMCVDIIEASEPASYVGNTTILHRGHSSPGVYWISKGKIKCTYLKDDQVIMQLHEGDCFGSFCLLDEACRCDYITEDICMVHFVAKSRLEEILETFKVDAIRFRQEALDDFNVLQQQRNAFKSMLRLRRCCLSRGNDQSSEYYESAQFCFNS